MNVQHNYLQCTLIGALTSKPYAFTARSWELKNTETIDLFESICSNIRIDTRGSDIMRILPLNNEVLNEEWISDKTRFAYDGLKRKRFINPMIKKNDLFVQTSWKKVFSFLKEKSKETNFDNIIINTGDFNDLEHLTTLKAFSNVRNKIYFNPAGNKNVDFQNYYTLNNDKLLKTDKKIFILIGINLRLENPILNIKLRNLSQKNSTLVGYIGPSHNYNLNAIHLGNNISTLNNILKGKHKFCSLAQNFLKRNNKNAKIHQEFKNDICLIFGDEFNKLKNRDQILQTIEQSKKLPIKFDINVLNSSVGDINKSELGLISSQNPVITKDNNNLYYLSGSETVKDITENDFVIFQGTHNEKLRTKFDVILPSVNWTEKSGIYINCLGLIQKTRIAVTAPVNTRLDWKISRLITSWLAPASKTNLPFDNINSVHNKINDLSPNLMNSISKFNINNNQTLNLDYFRNWIQKNKDNFTTFKSLTSNYYYKNSIDKNSKVMVKCTELLNKNKNNFNK